MNRKCDNCPRHYNYSDDDYSTICSTCEKNMRGSEE